jgi:hypothetical protein
MAVIVDIDAVLARAIRFNHPGGHLPGARLSAS